ncbi:hypothetical protein BOX15_Mlig028345g1 [Macrostomum lignano]|uniref:Protein kinase domain-containing protein n=1 Tax=Macrostomum lignano TaxID=282301 RepID=A0A267DZR8_9PLAT|nr:hypothetical protein BOX15_Mlig028345g2 [Macrostomum lignano]PAA59204.1 hypothetical protein BOX15_Mlig028345g1 [Macrostomum lignano]
MASRQSSVLRPERLSMWSTGLDQESLSGDIAVATNRLEKLAKREETFKEVFSVMTQHSDFSTKYDVSGENPLIYVYTSQPDEYSFITEVFPVVKDKPTRLAEKQAEELTFHQAFEEVIERYTNERRKPNPVLQETRSSDFCYQLILKIEAIPVGNARFPEPFKLVREFKILQHIWENYRTEMLARKTSPDQLVGFPMPFEFKNLIGSSNYDFPKMEIDGFHYYNLNGKSDGICRHPISPAGFGTDAKNMMSSFSYLSVEKTGPSVPYLMQLMVRQGKKFSLSTALKILDQLISRLMILHKYGVVHCDVNPGCLSFGCREAMNVLYITSFDKAVLGTQQSSPIHLFHDRFVAYSQVKDKKCHYVCDLESAFYVFVYCLLNRLPWDSRLQLDSKSVSQPCDVIAEKSRTIDMKEKFWSSNDSIHMITKRVTYEFSEGLYTNFSIDVLESLFAKMRENMATCINIPVTNYFKEIFVPGSAPYNCYFSIRKIIASYFRFEILNQSMKDVTCASKLEMLTKQDRHDKRCAWDLSYWCWNFLDADPDKKRLRAA